MKKTILTCVLVALTFVPLSAQAAQTGSVVGWGKQVVGVGTSAGFTAISSGYSYNLGLKVDGPEGGRIIAWGNNYYGQCNVPTPNSDFVAIAAGNYHGLGLKDDGYIAAWGANNDGQCNIPTPNTGFIAIAAGAYHSLGLKDDGSIVAWGWNDWGQCDVPAPNSGFIAVAAGGAHSLGLKDDGSVVAWGANFDGQCNITAPNTGFVAIAAGSWHSLGLKDDGPAGRRIAAWGQNRRGQCNVPAPNSGFIDIAGGYYHSLGIKDDGTACAWGDNDEDQCNVPALNNGFIAIAAGWGHSLGLKEDGSIAAWGANFDGQCNIPAPNSDFIDIAAGREHSLALKDDGPASRRIAAWGRNNNGQCNVPAPNTGFIAIAASGHSLGLKDDGSIAAWGDNNDGQCDVPAPNSSFVAIAAGHYHSLGLKDDGSVVAWGLNNEGQCDVPQPNTGFIAIAAGYEHSLGLKNDGTAYAWGNNDQGQCDIPAPNSDFVTIAAGYEHSLGLKDDGTAYAWGKNDQGQCDIPAPNTGFVAIAAGYNHNLGLKDDSTACAWGKNDEGQCDVPTPNTGFIAITAGSNHSLGLKYEHLTVDLTVDQTWMYQNLPGSTNSNLTAIASIISDPLLNSSYTYDWELVLPDDITVEPATVSGGQVSDTSFNFAAPGCDQPAGLSDSGRPLTVKVTVTGVDHSNTGSDQAQFGIALLGDVNNDTTVNIADRSIINAFWRIGSAGSFTLKDCDVNSDDSVNIADRSIANAIWRGTLGANSVSNPCLLRQGQVPSDMVFIPKGDFEMGDHFAPEGQTDELPVHAVLVDAFFMSKFEITNQQYCDYLNSAYPAQLKVVSGIVYADSDTGNNYPYCDTYSASSDSQIDFTYPDFSVRSKDARDMSDDPMVQVSWYGAVAYCNWRSSEEGYQACYNLSTWGCDFTKKAYRLPTEAEWEYAARGGEHSPYYRFPWGDTISHSRANYYAYPESYTYDINPTTGYHPLWNGVSPYTSPIGFFDGTTKYKANYNWPGSDTSYQTTSGANAYGLHDMAGNVWELCNDWYHAGYYSTTPYPHVNPEGPADGDYRVLRGGSWYSTADGCRVALRGNYNPDGRSRNSGFRIVLTY